MHTLANAGRRQSPPAVAGVCIVPRATAALGTRTAPARSAGSAKPWRWSDHLLSPGSPTAVKAVTTAVTALLSALKGEPRRRERCLHGAALSAAPTAGRAFSEVRLRAEPGNGMG